MGGDFPTSTEAEILIKAHKLNLEAFGSKNQIEGLKLPPKMIEQTCRAHVIYIFIWLIRLLLMFSSQRWSYQAPGCEPLAQNPSGSWREPKAAHRKSCGNLESQRCPKKCRLTTKDIVELCSDLKVALSGYPLLKRISYFAKMDGVLKLAIPWLHMLLAAVTSYGISPFSSLVTGVTDSGLQPISLQRMAYRE